MEKLNLPHIHLTPDDIEYELLQSRDEGKIVDESEFHALLNSGVPDDEFQKPASDLLDRMKKLPVHDDYPYVEPSGLDEIKKQRGTPLELPSPEISEKSLANKIHGAWLGRCCGCLLGKPVEGWHRSRIEGYLRDTDQFPLSDYFSSNASREIRKKYDIPHENHFIESVTGMPQDDDLNYTVAGLCILEKHGLKFTPANVARFWLGHIPVMSTFTAERVAIRNFLMDISPPESATFRNPYREWIGAQIRADFYGYATPGNPDLAAELAFREASISHVKNGIYGAMWSAAMISTAFTTGDLKIIILSGLARLPQKSRFVESVKKVMEWHKDGLGYEEAVNRIHEIWNEKSLYGWCHVISNAMIVTVALLWGEGDFEKSVCRAVQPGFDTDCNGATAGSILGVIHGSENIPEKWTSPLNDTLETCIVPYTKVKISDLAKRTVKVITSI